MTNDHGFAELQRVLARIDEALAPLCGQRQTVLAPDSSSTLYCSEDCQERYLDSDSGSQPTHAVPARQTTPRPTPRLSTAFCADPLSAALAQAGGQVPGRRPSPSPTALDRLDPATSTPTTDPDHSAGPLWVGGQLDPVVRSQVAAQIEADLAAGTVIAMDHMGPLWVGGQLDPVVRSQVAAQIEADLVALLPPAVPNQLPVAPNQLAATLSQAAKALRALVPPPPPPPRSALVRAWLDLARTIGHLLRVSRQILAAVRRQLADEVRGLWRLAVRAVRALGRRWS